MSLYNFTYTDDDGTNNIVTIKAKDTKELLKKVITNYDKFDNIIYSVFYSIAIGRYQLKDFSDTKIKDIEKVIDSKEIRKKFLITHISKFLSWFPLSYKTDDGQNSCVVTWDFYETTPDEIL